jgi:hypothetical protein
MGAMRFPERARLGAAALLATVPAAAGVGAIAGGCADKDEAPVAITAVTPAAAYNDVKVSLVIEGGPFRPVFDIDTSGARESTELGAFTAFLTPVATSGGGVPADLLTWVSTSELAAVLPNDVPRGTYDVEVRDPRGRLARLPGGFESLGADVTKSIIVIDEPPSGTVINAGAVVPVAFHADDGHGALSQLSWAVSSSDFSLTGTCPLPPNASRATCRFVFTAPEPAENGQPLNIIVTALDSAVPAPNPNHDQATLAVAFAPVVGAFSPVEGPARGGTLMSVTGANFVAGTQVLVGGLPLDPDGGVVVSSTLVQGVTRAHDPGSAMVTVRTGSSTASFPGSPFKFIGRPEVWAVTPTSGPVTGCAPITIVGKYFRTSPRTAVWFGSDSAGGAPLQCANVVSANRIEGLTPPGVGAVTVFAGDPVGDVGSLVLGYTYLDVDAPDGGDPSVGGGAGADAGTDDAGGGCPCPGAGP